MAVTPIGGHGIGADPGGYTGPSSKPGATGKKGGGGGKPPAALGGGGGGPLNIPAPPAPGQPLPVYTAPPINTNVTNNPQLQETYDAYKQYQSGLASGSDQDAVNAMQRQRDLASGMLSERKGLMSQRGALPGSGASDLFTNRALDLAQRGAQETSTNLASDARQKQLQALSGRMGAAGAMAQDLSSQRNYGLAQWQAAQQAANAQAQLQAMLAKNSWEMQLGMLNAGSNFYSGF